MTMTTMNQWKAADMHFRQVWNPDLGFHPEKRKYTTYAFIYDTPGAKSITLWINVEEGIVFYANEQDATDLFENEMEAAKFIQLAQDKFDRDVDMGKALSSFVFGYGGKMKSLPEYQNEQIEYIPIIYPNNEKYENPRYKEKVQRSLISKGAIMIEPKGKDPYLAVIQRKKKPRDLTPFGYFIPRGKEKENPSITPPNPPKTEQSVAIITLPKWLAMNVGVNTQEKEVAISAPIQQETEKAILIQFQGKTAWLPKSKITIA